MADAVYEDLRCRLMAGMLAPGERLSLREISSALGVSVMPVREAVNRLVAERALEVTPSRTLRVPLSSPSQVRDLADIRGRVEGFAAERAALNRTPEQLAAIEAAELDMRTALECRDGDPARWVALNQAFHFAIYEAAGMPLLLKMIGDLWLKAGPTLNLDILAGSDRLLSGVALRCHAAATAAIRKGDGAAAYAAISHDIDSAARFVIDRSDYRKG